MKSMGWYHEQFGSSCSGKIFPEIPWKEGSCCVSCTSVSPCFEAVVNPLGRASVSSVIAEAVLEFLS